MFAITVKEVLVARGIKGISNFGSKLRLADSAEGDERGELSEEDFERLMKEDKLGLTPVRNFASARLLLLPINSITAAYKITCTTNYEDFVSAE